MGTKATRKDFYMEIRKSLGRFLSIFFIVALGVAFFSGIRASEPAMRITGDSYYDAADLMDIRAVSALGITEDDINAINKLESISKVEGGYSADFLTQGADRQIALHVLSLLPSLNKVTVSEGRLPEKAGECLADDAMDYKIGDTILLESGDGKAVRDTLNTEKLKVVGLGNSPCYISYNRGGTTIGTGSVAGFLFVAPETFKMDAYTEIYAQVDGAKKEIAYTGSYDEKVEAALNAVEGITKERGSIRRQELIDEASVELDKAKKDLEEGKEKTGKELDAAVQELSDGENQLNDAKAKIADGRAQIENAKAALYEKQNELDAAASQYNSGRQQLLDGWVKYQQGQEQFEQQKTAYEAQIQSGREQLAQTRAQLDLSWTQYQGMLAQIEQLKAIGNPTGEQIQILAELEQKALLVKAGLDDGEQKYADGAAELDGYQAELDAGAAKLDSSREALDASEAQLADALAQIQSGQNQINAGWEEIYAQEDNLTAAGSEIASRERELSEGRQQYEEAKSKADAGIADGERQVRMAEREIGKINNPKWYLYDRNSLPEYTGFGDNADRMKQIGKVFPVLFFLVAALISLTSMTRMVEEQRTEIGTMKALGYGKLTIASKYLGYALLATMGGSILGVLFGEKALPYIIIYAYGILYHHLPQILTPYNLTYAAFATFAAVACTMFATLAACYKEMSAQPAVLMRPPAPKNGKRVFMERVGFLWRHLSFTWKSTIRNLMRYKKRFFMTIFGIGGCMALMLVGFGLRDSIFDIAGVQYQQIQTYEGSAYLEDDIQEGERAELAEYLKDHKNVEAFIDANMRTVTVKHGDEERDVYECVPRQEDDIESFIHLRDRKTGEKYKLSDRGVIISEKTAKLLDAGKGDTIEIKDGEDTYKPVEIDQICENYMGHYLYMTPSLYRELYAEEPEYNCIYFKTADASTEALEKTGQEILARDEVLSVTYLKDFMKQLNDMLKSLNLVIVVLIVSAGMLAFVVLYNLNFQHL